jgi:high-affinity iron transporter
VLPTFVIGLREGLEAALIVGIVAAFLRQQGRPEALRWMWVGVVTAVTLCAAGGFGLHLAEEQLPQRQQEGLETVIGLVAVGMITWMIVWVHGHVAGLRTELQMRADVALAAGSAGALAGMAFLAVLREGLETSVFLLAAFQASDRPALTGTGAVLGVLVAAALGYAIYRGGVRINLGRFFRVTGIVLVLVAAGLLATAVHTAHEAGWLNGLQGQALDLTWLVRPGSVQSALLTGMLGIQPTPTVGELVVWLAFAAPMLVYVWRPPRRPSPERAASADRAAPGPPVPVGPVGSAMPTLPTVGHPLSPPEKGPRP